MARAFGRRIAMRAVCGAAIAASLATGVGAQSIAANLGSTARVVADPSAEIAVPLIIDLSSAGPTTIASLQAALTWNPAIMTFDSLRIAGGVTWVLFANTANAAAGSVTFNTFDAAALPATATLANAYFTGNGGAGGTRLLLTPTAAGSATGQNVLPFIRPRALDVCLATSGRVGDVNGDDAVNIIDAQQISRFTVGLSVANPTLIQQRGDVNTSGAVDIVDGQQIARFSVGLSAAPLINTESTFIPMATGVDVTPGANQSLSPGGTVQLLAAPTTGGGATNLTGCAPVTWQSSNTNVAVVNASGFVTAVGGGTAAITAISGGGSDMVGVAVSGSSSAPVASVSVTLASSTITIGASTQATATLRDASNNLISGRPITWASTNSSCATVNSATGVVTGVASCSANIVATAEGVSGQGGVSVMQAAVSTVTVSLASGSIGIGETTQATASVRDVGGNLLSGRTIAWSSSNTARATVGTSGIVTGLTSGTAAVIATVEGVTGQATVNVAMAPVATITVNLDQTVLSATTPITTTTNATAVLRDAGGNILTGRTVTWSSSAPSRATVNSSTGVVTAVSPGTADIIATSEGVTALRTITLVTPPVATVSVSLAAPSILPGGTTLATAVVRDDKTNVLTGRAVSFSSSNTSVAGVGSSSGSVTGVANGTSNIVATSEGRSGQATVTVAQSVSNEPPGLARITDRPFNCQKPSECESDWSMLSGFTIAQDSTAPRSPINVGQMRYGAGFGGGNSPGNTWRYLDTKPTTLYVRMWVKYSSNWQAHGSGVNKILFLWINGGSRTVFIARGDNLVPTMALQAIGAPYNNGSGQTSTSVHLTPNIVPGARLTRGEWHQIEIIMVANTAGVANGSTTFFHNGVKIGEYTGIMYTPAGGSSKWEYVMFDPTWGGTGETVTNTMYLWMDHLYASGKQ